MSKHARLESLIIRSLTRILREEVKDPAVNFVTITGVKLTIDLSFLTIFYTNLQEDRKEDVASALERSKPFIRSALGRHVQMRKLPALKFSYDASLDTGNRIESGLKKVLDEE
ncbi:MAG: 30S ribosome-binding factor RbfA [Acholeplasmatales bacterium]|nr:MAG: 30S ribosome-binding factor RbfA [Acholeplasmatales bacterium]